MWYGHIGRKNVAKHRIELLNDKVRPVQSALFCMGQKTREFEQVEIYKMVKQKVSYSEQTKCAALIFFLSKNNGTVRFYVDYMKPNGFTKLDPYPIPRLDECIDSLEGATVFSTLDASSAYWGVESDVKYLGKSAFKSLYERYKFIRLRFGLPNAQ